ncbi:MAG TPA: amidohydrolase family protein [Mycobacteriales bacterium]|jgi:predicted TIM-barrel fold metal-dependent hydrolase|nr:amidohydrolase family protein [Mycobacteriales bacterium]
MMATNPVTGYDFRIISTDCHVDPPGDDLVAKLPEHLRQFAPQTIVRDGVEYIDIPGLAPISKAFSDGMMQGDGNIAEREREFRNDPDGGRNLEKRSSQLARDGVWGEVVFPHSFLGLSAHPNADYQREMTKLYNDFCAETFLASAAHRDRYAPSALLSTLEPADAVAEAIRAKELGYVCVMLPPIVPWLPYWHSDWAPLWRTLEELDLVVNFHVFTGNTAQGVDFGNLWVIPPDLAEVGRARFRAERVDERLSTTVMCMASNMSPMMHLIGSGILDRHPNLKFALVESEAGWIPWALQALDLMQKRRRFAMINLELEPSEYFRRQGWGTFLEDQVAIDTLEYLGEDNLMWSNDWPHDEGTFLESQMIIKELVGHLPSTTQKKLLRDNAASLYSLDQLEQGALV